MNSRSLAFGCSLLLFTLLFFPETRADDPPSEVTVSVAEQIDRYFATVWSKAEEEPGLCDDAAFLRRVSLDICGVVPAPEEVNAFLADDDPKKRARKVDELLERPEAAAHWGTLWTTILLGRRTDLGTRGVNFHLFRRWATEAWKNEMPWSAFVRKLITATGPSDTNGPVSFVLRQGSKENLIGNVSRLFLGVQIQCAQCHDHPYDDWTQKDFYGMLAYVSRTERRVHRAADVPDEALERMSDMQRRRVQRRLKRRKEEMARPYRRLIVFDRRRGEARLPDGGPTIKPRFLGADVESETLGRKRRRKLADHLIAHPLFPKAILNRLWDVYIGQPFSYNPDDLGGRIRHEKLLSALATRLVEEEFDLRPLIRGICLSKAYQVPSASPVDAEKLNRFSVRRPKPLSPEQLFYSTLEATGLEKVRALRNRKRLERQKQRLLQYFLFTFGDDEDSDETAFSGTIPQALLFMNGKWINRMVGVMRGGTLHTVLRKRRGTRDRIRYLFRATLSREPAKEELDAFRQTIEAAGDRPSDQIPAYEDCLWALLNSAEFAHAR